VEDRVKLNRPEDLDPIDEVSSSLGITLALVDREMNIVWANGKLESLFREPVPRSTRHCFAALWARHERCPDCIPALVFSTGEPREGIRERGGPGEPPQPRLVRGLPVHGPDGRLEWVLEATMLLHADTYAASPGLKVSHVLAQISGAAGTAFVVVDTRDRIVSWNQTATVVFGHDLEDVLGRRIDLIVPQDLRDEETRFAEGVRTGARVPRTETERLAKDGRRIPVAVSAVPIRDETGDLVGRSIVLEDLSSMQRMRGLLADHEQLLATITRKASDAVVSLDADGLVTSWNDGAARICGREKDDVLNRPFDLIAGEGASGDLRSEIDRTDAVHGLRMDWRTAEGDRVPVEVTATRLGEDGGDGHGIAFIARDLSARLRLERRMVRSEKLAAVGSLAAGLAHEIGTPLNVISATAEYLLLENEQDDPHREELSVIVSETERISKLVRQLLALSREARDGVRTASPSEVVERVLGLLRVTMEGRGIRMETDVASDLPAVAMGPDELHQVILNLLVNAQNAVLDGGRIGIAVRDGAAPGATGEPNVRFEVWDDGPGVPEDLRERIFDPFFTTRHEGTGLGLAVCAGLVSGHGGDIGVQPGESRGAVFVMNLPVAREGSA
jgi:PAS domain S-box-containing protein